MKLWSQSWKFNNAPAPSAERADGAFKELWPCVIFSRRPRAPPYLAVANQKGWAASAGHTRGLGLVREGFSGSAELDSESR